MSPAPLLPEPELHQFLNDWLATDQDARIGLDLLAGHPLHRPEQGYPVLDADVARLSAFIRARLGRDGHYSFALPDLGGPPRPPRYPDAPDHESVAMSSGACFADLISAWRASRLDAVQDGDDRCQMSTAPPASPA
ncbi:hypothetical protein [Nocardia sp. NPDC049707]|uniref:hypothetical protein n=1 Tax=Nocardia sp. NPDC049707 TaxID=3154735 RepID=UPI003416546A